MKKAMLFCMGIIFLFTGCVDSKMREIPKSDQAVNHLFERSARSIEKKYKMKAIGTVVAMPEGVVKELGLSFQIQGPLIKEEIRKILITSAKDFLQIVNSDEAVRPYLTKYPFEIKNVEITLFLVDSQGIGLDDPYIGVAGLSRGELDYQILVTTHIPKIKCESVESYEEALISK